MIGAEEGRSVLVSEVPCNQCGEVDSSVEDEDFLVLALCEGRRVSEEQDSLTTLKTVASLNKESRPFFLGDNRIWSFLAVSSLSDYRI